MIRGEQKGGKLTPDIAGYEILGEIGSGRTATVYRALPRSGGLEVALKVLHRHLAFDSVLKERFRREVLIARDLLHPNILPVYDLVSWEESPILVMEYCPGGSLGEKAGSTGIGSEGAAGIRGKNGLIAGTELLSIAMQVGSALEAAHRKGIVHRDIKPSNLLRAADGSIKLGDFSSAGISRLLGLTRSTISFGSPEFTPPESLFDPYPDPRWDLFSLGAVLYRLGTGRSHSPGFLSALPSDAPAPEPPHTANPSIDPAFSNAILSLLEPIERRTSSASEFLAKIGQTGSQGNSIGSSSARKACLFCGASMPFDAPVCLECGEADVILERCTGPESESLFLRKIPEDASTMERFFRVARAITNDPSLSFRFLTEDRRLYSKDERKSSVALPAKLLDELHPRIVDKLIPLFKGNEKYPVILTRKPSRKTRKMRVLLNPRRCPQIPDSLLAVMKNRPAIGSRPGNASDRSILEKGTLAAGRIALSSARSESQAIDGQILDSLAGLLEAMDAIMAEAGKIRKGLDSVSLGEAYAQIHALGRMIADSSDPYQIDELIHEKHGFEKVIEAHRQGESAHALLIARIIAIVEELEKARAVPENSLTALAKAKDGINSL